MKKKLYYLIIITLFVICCMHNCGKKEVAFTEMRRKFFGSFQNKWVLDETYYLKAGHELTMEYIEKYLPSIKHIYQNSLNAVVRIKIRYNHRKNSCDIDHGSGVLVENGRYLITAGHVISILKTTSDATVEVILHDGKIFSAKPGQWQCEIAPGEQDLGVIKLSDKLDRVLPYVPLGKPQKSEHAIMIGFPANIGINESGSVQYDSSNLPLNPLAILTIIEDPEKITLRPIAGFIPIGGMSGGAVINAKGDLIGIFTAHLRHSTAGKIAPTYTLAATPIEIVRKLLLK